MKISIVATGFTSTQADELRRSMATFKAKEMVKGFQDKLVNGMLQNGYTQEYAEQICKQPESFGSIAFRKVMLPVLPCCWCMYLHG